MNSTIAINNFSYKFCNTVLPKNPLKVFEDIFNEEKLISNINSVINDMLSSITKMPTISNIPGIKSIHNTVSLIGYSCIGCIVCYKGVKLLFNPTELRESYENKELLGRIAYSVTFNTLSLKLIDTMIELANTMIDILLKNNLMSTLMPKIKGTGLLVAILLLLVELFVSLKILIEFWMRMAEMVFTGVVSPVIFVLWINKEWSGFLRTWWRRITVLVFTQVAQVLLLVIYSKMINGLVLAGSFNSLCLAIATLFLIDRTPKIVANFMDSGNNISTARSSIKHAISTISKTKGFITKIMPNK